MTITLTHPAYIKAEACYQQKEKARAMRLFKNLLKQEHISPELEQRLANRLGILYLELTNYKQSKQFFEKSLHLAKQVHCPVLTYNALDNLSAVSIAMRNMRQAIAYLQQAMTLKEKEGHTQIMSRSLIQLCGLHYLIENNTEGDKVLEHAKQIITQHKQKHLYAQLYFASGMKLKRMKQYSRAIAAYTKAAANALKQNDHQQALRCHANIAGIYSLEKKWSHANMHLQSALQLLPHCKNPSDELLLYTELTGVSIKMRKKDAAGKYFSKVKQLAKDSTHPMVLKILHYVSAQYYKANGELQKALKHYELCTQMHSKAYSEEMGRNIQELQTRYETEVNQRQLQEAKLQQAETQLTLLRTQMNPHFYTNILNTIEHYVTKNNTPETIAILHDFSRLTRMVLDNSRVTKLPLSQNLEMLELYLRLEQRRYDPSFTYHVKIENKLKPEQIQIHGMLLQPLIENAIRHGIRAVKDRTGHIGIDIKRNSNIICVTIIDNGIGRLAAETKKLPGHQSHSTNIIRETLRLLWKTPDGDKHLIYTDMTDSSNKVCGTKVELCFPLS